MMNRIAEIKRYLLLTGFPGRYFHDKGPKSNVVITMTTLPSRIANIAPTIASLTDQTVQPEKILINLPMFSKREQTGYFVPDFLKNHPLVEINRTEDDLGPATKLLPALKKYQNDPDKLIIVADDDEIYSSRIVENYLNHNIKGAVMTLVGWNAPRSGNHKDRTVKYGAIGEKPPGSIEVQEPTQVDCVQGASTFAVRPSYFSSEIFDYSKAPKEAFYVDDIYVSGHLAKQKIPIFVVPASFRYARMKVVKQLILSEALHKKENSTNHNNNTLYKFYEPFWPSLN